MSADISDQLRVDRGTAGIQLRERTRAPQVFILNTTWTLIIFDQIL